MLKAEFHCLPFFLFFLFSNFGETYSCGRLVFGYFNFAVFWSSLSDPPLPNPRPAAAPILMFILLHLLSNHLQALGGVVVVLSFVNFISTQLKQGNAYGKIISQSLKLLAAPTTANYKYSHLFSLTRYGTDFCQCCDLKRPYIYRYYFFSLVFTALWCLKGMSRLCLAREMTELLMKPCSSAFL